MAGERVGILHLQGIEIGVLTHRLQTLSLGGQILVILHHRPEQLPHLLVRQRSRIHMQGFHPHFQFQSRFIRIIHQPGLYIGKMETIDLLFPFHFQDLYHIPVGQEARFGILRQPKVIVPDYHQQFPGRQLVLQPEYPSPQFVIEQIGPLVGPSDKHHIFPFPPAILLLQHILQILARQTRQVRSALREIHSKQRQGRILLRNLLPQGGRILQNQRAFPLTHHFFQAIGIKMRRETGSQVFQIQCRTIWRTHWRQLGIVARKQDPATITAFHIIEEIE